MYIGKNIRYLRTLAGLSLEGLAAKINVSKTSVASYEQNKTYPDADIILNLCVYFQTDPTTLLLCDMEALGLRAGEVVGIADLLKPQDAVPAALVTDELLVEIMSLVENLLQTERTELDYLTEALARLKS